VSQGKGTGRASHLFTVIVMSIMMAVAGAPTGLIEIRKRAGYKLALQIAWGIEVNQCSALQPKAWSRDKLGQGTCSSSAGLAKCKASYGVAD
jgi:hypothetical protein